MLSLHSFHPASDKVRQAEFHPVLPWVVAATKSNHVSVFDWKTKQVIWEAQLGGGDEELSVDAELAQAHPRDGTFQPNPSLLHPVPGGGLAGGVGALKREPTGAVKDVHFLDVDVAQTQLSWRHSLASGCSSPPPRAADIRALRGQRLLIIACENKLLVVDLASRRVLDLGKGVFEGKAPTAVAFLFRGASHHAPALSPRGQQVLDSPVLAVGCSDGIVRCIQLFPTRPVMRLVSNHKSAVVSLLPLELRGHAGEALLVGHAGGSVALYEPAAKGGPAAGPGPSAASLAEGLGPRANAKAHDRELLPGSLAVVPVAEDPEDTRCLVFSAGADHRVMGLDVATLKETTKIKVPGGVLTCMAHWARGYVASGVHSLLLGTESGHVLLAHPVSGSVRQACELEAMIPAGLKRTPKVYGLHVHPTMPNYVAAATNTGVAVLTVLNPAPLAAVALPLLSPAAAHRDSAAAAMGAAFGGSAGVGATYVTAIGKQVLCVTAAALPNQDNNPFPPNQVMGKLQVASDTPGNRALVAASHDGGYVAVSWPAARQYAVYRQGASAWQEVTRGQGLCVAWHASRDVLAVLEEEAPSQAAAAAAAAAAAGKPSKDPKKAEKQAEAMRAAMEAAAKAAAATAAVRLKELQGSSVMPLGRPAGLDLRGDTPAFVQGGPLLAVTVTRAVQSPAQELAIPGVSAPPVMVLYEWDSQQRVGPELVEPVLMSWDPSRSLLALAYASQILLVRPKPSFEVVATLPIADATSMEWAARQLYIATPTQIYCAIVAPDPPTLPASATNAATASGGGAAAGSITSSPTASPARLITLAAPSAAATAALAELGPAAAADGFLPPPAVRPPGPLALLGPRDGCLWMVGVLGQPMALSLSHPGFQCCSLAASGDLTGAVSLAQRTLAPQHHDALAALLVELDGLTGATAAIALPGLTLECELRLRALLRHWQQAVEAAEALLAGYRRRPLPGQFRSAVAAAAFGGGGGGGYGGGDGAQLGDEFVDLSMAAGGNPATPLPHPEDLDWTEPLRAASSSAKAAATAAVAAGRAGPGRAPGVSRPAAVSLVLGLMDDLMRVGMYDVARHLAKALLHQAVHLGGDHLRALAGVLSQAGMKTDLPAVAHAVAAGSDGLGREGAGLMAALLSGHTALAQDSLRDGHATALAALQAKAFGLSTAAESVAAWRREVAAAAPGGAGVALGQLDVALQVNS